MPEVTIINQSTGSQSNKLRVAAYCRVSSNSDDQLNSYINQSKHYSDLIKNNDKWELVDIYADEGITGLKAETRHELQRLMKDCQKGKVDRVLTKSISRFSRNTADCLALIRKLKSCNVSIFFEKENIDTADLSGEMLISMFGAMAQEESISISNNMRMSYQTRMKSGNYITCSPAYGFRLKNGTLEPDEVESKIVKKIFNDYLNGQGVVQIARSLNEVYSQKNISKRWLPKAVSYILKNEKACGNALLQKEFTTGTVPFMRKRNKGELTKYFVENSHVGIIDKETFNKAQELIRSRGAGKGISIPNKYPFSKKIKCGECGHTFKRKSSNNKVYWVCYNHNLSKDNCSIKQIREDKIYNAFINLYNKLKLNKKQILNYLLTDLQALQIACSKNNSKIGELNREIAELTEQNHALTKLKSKGYMGSAIFMEKTNIINKQITDMRNARKQLLNDDDDDGIEKTKELMEFLETAPEELTSFNEEIFESMVNKIIVTTQTELIFKLINGLELKERID